jgi:hypothetical protein
MQIRYPVELTIEEYLEQEAWEQAKLPCCPFHPEGGCGLARHGTYPRKFPEYCLVARWYCPSARRTISLLPDFFASRFPGTLDEVEQTVNIAQSCTSREEAAEALRPDISLPSGLRWLRRRVRYVQETLTILAGLLVSKCVPELAEFRRKYHTDRVLTSLRDIAKEHLPSLPPIVGFGPRLHGRYCPSPSSNNRWGLARHG